MISKSLLQVAIKIVHKLKINWGMKLGDCMRVVIKLINENPAGLPFVLFTFVTAFVHHIQFACRCNLEELHFEELHHIVNCVPFQLLHGSSHVSVAIVSDQGHGFVLVAGIAFFDDHHCVGDLIEKVPGVLTGEVGETLDNELVVGLNSILFLEPGFQIFPCQLIG
jgi:hypothetical protein